MRKKAEKICANGNLNRHQWLILDSFGNRKPGTNPALRFVGVKAIMLHSEKKTRPEPIVIPLQTLHTEDLQGSILLPERPEAMVILAQVNSSRRQKLINLWVSATLNRKGIATLVLDLLPRNGTNSNGRRVQLELLTQRLELATRWLLRQPTTQSLTIGYFGTSIGAAAAFKAAAALGSRIQAVVSAGGRPDLAYNVLSKVSAATLFIVGERDHLGIDLNNEAFAEITSEKRLTIIPEATHLFIEPGALIQVGDVVSAWFKRYLTTSPNISFQYPAK